MTIQLSLDQAILAISLVLPISHKVPLAAAPYRLTSVPVSQHDLIFLSQQDTRFDYP